MVIGSRWSRHMTRRMARIRCNSLYTEKKRLAIMAPVVVMTPPSGVFVEWVITLIVIPCSLLLLSFSCSSSCSSYCSPLLSSSLPRCPWCHKPTQPHCPPHMHACFFSPHSLAGRLALSFDLIIRRASPKTGYTQQPVAPSPFADTFTAYESRL